MRASIEPSKTPAHDLNIERIVVQVSLVHIGNLKLPSRAGFDRCSNIAYPMIIKIEARYRITTSRLLGFFFDRERLVIFIKFNYAVALRIVHVIRKYRCTSALFISALQLLNELMAIKNIITQHQGAGIIAYKRPSQNKGLCETIGGWLYAVADI